MVDDTNKHTEEEYEFVDPDSKDVFSQQTTSAAKAGGIAGMWENKTLRRNVLIGLGVIIVVLLGYRLLTPFLDDREQDFEIPAGSEIVQIEQPPARVAEPVMDAGAANLRRDLAAVSLQMDRQSQMVNELMGNIAEINATVKALDTRMRAVDDAIERLAGELARQKQKIDQLQQMELTTEGYHIQAIIPGRAWLKNKDGSTLTVRQGTQVPGYGQVQYIDPMQGQVILNTGRVITYNPEDS